MDKHTKVSMGVSLIVLIFALFGKYLRNDFVIIIMMVITLIVFALYSMKYDIKESRHHEWASILISFLTALMLIFREYLMNWKNLYISVFVGLLTALIYSIVYLILKK